MILRTSPLCEGDLLSGETAHVVRIPDQMYLTGGGPFPVTGRERFLERAFEAIEGEVGQHWRKYPSHNVANLRDLGLKTECQDPRGRRQ